MGHHGSIGGNTGSSTGSLKFGVTVSKRELGACRCHRLYGRFPSQYYPAEAPDVTKASGLTEVPLA